jgi:hypothetical protein
MGIVLMFHSIIRWLIVLVGLIVLVKFALGWLRKMEFTRTDSRLSSGFSGLMDLNVLLGLIFLFWTGFTGAGFPRFRIEHAFTMIIALVIAHLPIRWKESADEIRFRNTLIAFVISLVLIFLGVFVLPGGWTR